MKIRTIDPGKLGIDLDKVLGSSMPHHVPSAYNYTSPHARHPPTPPMPVSEIILRVVLWTVGILFVIALMAGPQVAVGLLLLILLFIGFVGACLLADTLGFR